MDIEVELSPVVSVEELLDLARIVDISGASRLGISDVALLRDTYELQALCATVTNNVTIGSLVTNPYLRHPAIAAAALGTLNEVSRGRAYMGIGVGAGLSRLGIDQSGPVQRLEEFIRAVKELLTGRPVNLDGPNYRISGARLQADIAGPVPIIIGTRSPQICKLAGRLADGVVVGARELPESALRRYQQWVRQGAEEIGRDPAEVDIAPRMTVCISHEGEQARRSVVLYAAHYLALGGLEASRLPAAEFDRISSLVAQATGWYFEADVSYPHELDDIIGSEIIDRFTISGTPADCLPKFQSLSEMGFRTVSIGLAAVRRPDATMYDGLKESLQGLTEIVPQIRAL